MAPTQTPAVLTTIWSVTHGLSTFYQGEQILAEDGLLLLAADSGFTIGVTSVVFDDDTGEPLAFQSLAAISPGSAPGFLGVWHFPAESCLVVVGYEAAGLASATRLWARRVYYDSAGNLSTPDPLTTWSPNLTAADVPCAIGCASSSSLNAIWFSTTSCKTTTMDLAAGTVGTVNTHTLSSIFGGSIDRVQLVHPLIGDHTDAAVLCTAYQNAAGVTTAQTYVVRWTGGTPTAAVVSSSRATSMGTGPPDQDRTLMDVGGLGGGPRRLTAPGGTFVDVQEPTANFIFSTTNRTTRAIPGHYDSHNREDLTYGTVSGSNDKRRVREWLADTGAEVFAWEYPNSIGNHPYTGRLVKRGQFWFTRSTTTFSVHEGAFPGGRKWWLGVAGWGG